jgi:hypothetical protein
VHYASIVYSLTSLTIGVAAGLQALLTTQNITFTVGFTLHFGIIISRQNLHPIDWERNKIKESYPSINRGLISPFYRESNEIVLISLAHI